MNIFRTLAITVVTTILVGAADPISPSTTSPAPMAAVDKAAKTLVEPPAQLTLIDATEEQTHAIAEAIALFDDADLSLPPLRIEFYDTTDGCHGHAGQYQQATAANGIGVDRIALCNHRRSVALHELAHAWMRHNLDDQTRQSVMDHWGLERWRDKTDAHLDRGVERAAETIAFTLNQVDPDTSDGILRYICSYEVVTGATLEIHSKVTC